MSGAREALSDWAPQPLVSARSCLRDGPLAGFAQDYHSELGKLGAGFPEFTRCCNHSFLWKLQPSLQPVALPTELPGNATLLLALQAEACIVTKRRELMQGCLFFCLEVC